MRTFLKKTADTLFNALFPAICANCQKILQPPEDLLCALCMESIRINTSFFCPACRRRLPDARSACNHSRGLILAAISDYSIPALRAALFALKYRSFRRTEKTFEPLVGKYLANLKFDFAGFVVVPVPLHQAKLNARGFNQAEIIAGLISKNLGLPVVDALVRKRNTKPQSKMKKSADRLQNVRECFDLKNNASLREKNIILVDDIFTTGATAFVAAETLKNAGAGKIIIFTAAKT